MKRTLLIILDGFGLAPHSPNNAISQARTPHIDRLFQKPSFTKIEGSGLAVGLPKGLMGNSEVGHLNLGAGRSVEQDVTRINKVIKDKKLSELEALNKFTALAKKSGKIHLMGLYSSGGVHSHLDQIHAFFEWFCQKGITVYFHAFLDGRDTPPKSAQEYLKNFPQNPNLVLASLSGRSIAMDRDQRWEKIETAYQMLTSGTVNSQSPEDFLQECYQNNVTDEFIAPTLFSKDGKITSEDPCFFINFRPDRARQISLSFLDSEFTHFPNPVRIKNYLCMTPYLEPSLGETILFHKEKISGGLSEIISQKNRKQFRIAETEKYAHVTYFFNGGREAPYPGETRVLVKSPRDVKTYDQKPEMSAYEVTEKLIHAMSEDYQFYLVNFANADMVGHTGNLPAAIKAIEALDDCVGQLMDAAKKNNIKLFLTSDHGNADQMIDSENRPHTAHTTNLVPFVLDDENLKMKSSGSLQDVAPTILDYMNIPIPNYFTGQSLLEGKKS